MVHSLIDTRVWSSASTIAYAQMACSITILCLVLHSCAMSGALVQRMTSSVVFERILVGFVFDRRFVGGHRLRLLCLMGQSYPLHPTCSINWDNLGEVLDPRMMFFYVTNDIKVSAGQHFRQLQATRVHETSFLHSSQYPTSSE